MMVFLVSLPVIVKILNAFISGKITGELRKLLEAFDDRYSQRNSAVLMLYTYISKGLILRSHKTGYDMIGDIIQLLSSNSKVSLLASSAFDIILRKEADGLLCRSSFAKTSPVFKQRFFESCKKPLMDGFENATGGEFAFLTS